jgi:hypothetical protein
MIFAPIKRRERGLESPEVLAEWNARCAESRARHAAYAPALKTLDSREGDALDVATILRGERAGPEGEGGVYFD